MSIYLRVLAILAFFLIGSFCYADDQLSGRAQVIESAYAKLIASRSAKTEEAYIDAFPKKFDEFLEVFHPADFGELYDASHSYIFAFGNIVNANPKKYGETLMVLAGGACLDVDAPNYLKKVLKDYFTVNIEVYGAQLAKMSSIEKVNVENFLNASLHGDSTSGVCNFNNASK